MPQNAQTIVNCSPVVSSVLPSGKCKRCSVDRKSNSAFCQITFDLFFLLSCYLAKIAAASAIGQTDDASASRVLCNIIYTVLLSYSIKLIEGCP